MTNTNPAVQYIQLPNGTTLAIEIDLSGIEEDIANINVNITQLQDGKQDALVSGTNIKTINNQSILGEGNLEIESGSAGVTDYDELDNRPKINNVELSGNKSLSDLGIQPEGSYVTSNPTGLNSINIGGESGTYSNAVTIGKSSFASNRGVAIGIEANADATSSVAIGDGSFVNFTGNEGIALGKFTYAHGEKSVSIGGSGQVTGTRAISICCDESNNVTKAFNVYDYTILNGQTGKIPDARLNDTIATTSFVESSISDSLGEIQDGIGQVLGNIEAQLEDI